MSNASKENIKKLKIAADVTLKEALIGNDKEYGLNKFIELLIANKAS